MDAGGRQPADADRPTHVYDLANRETTVTEPSGVKTVTVVHPDGDHVDTVQAQDSGGTPADDDQPHIRSPRPSDAHRPDRGHA